MKTKLLTKMRNQKRRRFIIDDLPDEKNEQSKYYIIYKGILPRDLWEEAYTTFSDYGDAEMRIEKLIDDLIRLEL